MTELVGQISIWDLHETDAKRKPCEYSFQRYIGQTVRCSWSGRVGKIVAIDHYYTDVQTSDGEVYAWTSTNTIPFEFNKEEWNPIGDGVAEWDKAKLWLPLVKPMTKIKLPDELDLVINGTVNGKPALIGFRKWISGFEHSIEYEPVLWKEVKDANNSTL